MESKSYNALLLEHAWQVLRKRWWWLAVGLALGAAVGLPLALRKGLVYEAKATYVMPVDAASAEIERLGARDLILAAIRRLNYVEVEHFNDLGLRGKYNMYEQTPFVVRILSFPDHLRGQYLPLQFEKGGTYTLEIPMDGANATLRGAPGVATGHGAVEVVLEQTAFWLDRHADQKFYVRVNDESALVDHFWDGFSIWNSLDRPDRVELTYLDRDPARALDLLAAYTAAYSADLRERETGYLLRQQSNIELEMSLIRAQMATMPDLWAQYEQLRQPHWPPTADSLMQDIQRGFGEMRRLESRAAAFRHWVRSGYDPALVPPMPGHRTHADSLLAEVVRQRDSAFAQVDAARAYKFMNAELSALSMTIVKKDSLRMLELRDTLFRNQAAFDLLTDYWHERAFLDADARKGVELPVFAVERYLELQEDRYTLEKELRAQRPQITLTEQPYLSTDLNPRRDQIRIGLTCTGAGFAISALLLLVTLVAGRGTALRETLSQLRRDVPFLHLTSHPLSMRKLGTELERLFPTAEVRTIAIMGQPAACEAFARELAAFFAATDTQVALVNVPAMEVNPDWASIALPSDSPAWWLSDKAAAFLKDLESTHGRILACLPDVNSTPEAIGVLRHVQATLYLADDKAAPQAMAAWQEWVRMYAVKAVVVLKSP